ncbi:MAG: helix-turn-helix domain-containing protein [Brevundimonas sp.]|uniref:helix-turn-helix domain-containing protein n=1 Tax=Brevundimonas sp. TaxID=1871086 RepID=UPI0027365D2E|nr:helix-turn-helix domain-containing protein [Brevundimonas sp.]MDP3379326.1 helix-turn-helix domain-containing protein [Brevundimonas sp.]
MSRQPRRQTSREGTPVDSWVGGRIASRRQALGLSQTTLAERVGVSFQQIQKYETGINRISASRLHQIALALGAEPGSFFPTPDPSRPLIGSSTPPRRPPSPGGRLAEAFSHIPDPKARRALVVLAECLAGPSGAHP